MVVHIVLFRWKESAEAEAIERAMAELRNLSGRIEEILELTCGQNFSTRAQGYTHALVVRLPDRAALDVYGPHPLHRHVVETFIQPIVEDVLAVDYEV